MRLHPKRVCFRLGFTLVEMLVVIAIIGILGFLAVGAVMKVNSGQRHSNTITTMSTIDKTLKAHWAYVIDQAKKETDLGGPYAAIDSVFGKDISGGDRNKVIWIKMRLMEAFPISYDEITNNAIDPKTNLWSVNSRLFPYKTNIIPPNLKKNIGSYATKLGGRTADYLYGLTESSACLLLALSTPRNGTALDVENLGSSRFSDNDGDGIQELVDGWGNPFLFFRFPTDNLNLQLSNPATGAAPTATNADPVDPGGALLNWYKLVNAGKWPSTSQTQLNLFRDYVHKIASPFSPNPKTPIACYIQPTIVSWGADGNISGIGGGSSLVFVAHKNGSAFTDKSGNQIPVPYGLGLDFNIQSGDNNIGAVPQLMGITDPNQEADNIYSFKLR